MIQFDEGAYFVFPTRAVRPTSQALTRGATFCTMKRCMVCFGHVKERYCFSGIKPDNDYLVVKDGGRRMLSTPQWNLFHFFDQSMSLIYQDQQGCVRYELAVTVAANFKSRAQNPQILREVKSIDWCWAYIKLRRRCRKSKLLGRFVGLPWMPLPL